MRANLRSKASVPGKESPAGVSGQEKKPLIRFLQLAVVYLTLGALLIFAFRNVPLEEIWNTLRRLQPWQALTLIGLNLFIYSLLSLRWWVIVRAENRQVAYLPLLFVRVAVFGVSYFTFGPHVGGEPLQVFHLQRRYGTSFTHATASVIMDKLLELLANFVLLSVGLTAILQAGLFSANGSSSRLSLAALVVVCLWPPLHILLLYRKRYPLSAVLRAIPFLKKDSKPIRFIAASERLAGTFCRRHFRSLLVAIGISLAAASGMVAEFALITRFLEIDLPFWQTLAAWTAGWLALLAPLPAGVGALEATEVLALGAFGVPGAAALGVTLVMRGRDVLVGGLGLLIAGRTIRQYRANRSRS